MEGTTWGAYEVCPLKEADVEAVLELCQGNPLYYEYHPPKATRQSILEDMAALPPGKEPKDKRYLGLWLGGELAAVMDLVLAYPDEECAYIGFFMVRRELQGKGVGSEIVRASLAHLGAVGFRRVELAIDRGNPQSRAFWEKNGFRVREQRSTGYIPMVLWM